VARFWKEELGFRFYRGSGSPAITSIMRYVAPMGLLPYSEEERQGGGLVGIDGYGPKEWKRLGQAREERSFGLPGYIGRGGNMIDRAAILLSLLLL
jgi:hypothetical protein